MKYLSQHLPTPEDIRHLCSMEESHSCPIRTLPDRSRVGRTGQSRLGRSFITKATLIGVACMILMTFPVPASQLQTTAPSQTTDRTLFPGYDRYSGHPRRRHSGRQRGVHPGSYPPERSAPRKTRSPWGAFTRLCQNERSPAHTVFPFVPCHQPPK